MTRKVAWIPIALTLILPVSAYAQTPSEINALLRKSKFVDAGREVNTVLGSNQATISTFCHPQATDQDCKVTALLMMKELRQHYKSIHRIRVLFYDPANIRSYRDVEIREGDVLQVDMGKPLKTVLAQISVAKRSASATTNSASRSSSRTSGSKSGSLVGAYETYQDSNGQFSVQYPKNWTVMSENGALLKVYTQRRDGSASLALLRVALPWGPSVEDLANSREAEMLAKFAGYKKRAHRAQSCSGASGVYLEGSAHLNGSEVVDRSLFLQSHKAYYTLQMQSTGLNDAELSNIFTTVMNSLRING